MIALTWDTRIELTDLGRLTLQAARIEEEINDLAADAQEGASFNFDRHAALSAEAAVLESVLTVLSPDFTPPAWNDDPDIYAGTYSED